jgi:lipoyl(octanoyl) transferase
MKLEHFDEGRFPATENMARDLVMLENYPRADVLRFRHYGWEPDCFSFGYSQPYEWIKGQAVRGAQLARRPTGGGLVDHRNDWTYAFVIPPTHPFHHAPALDVYRFVHEAIAEAMSHLGRPASLQPEKTPEAPTLPGMPQRVRGLCFAGAETYDVIDPKTRIKLAGAAMKRNHEGLLMQGSIDRLTTGDIDWTAFRACFIHNLAVRFGATEMQAVDAPVYPAEVLKSAIEKLSSDHWNKRR